MLSPLDEIMKVITTGRFFSIPTIALMAITFIVGLGLALGYVLIKTLKVFVVVALAAIIAAYFGWFGLSLEQLKGAIDQYGPQMAQYAGIFIGALPLGLGFLVGFLLGFLLA